MTKRHLRIDDLPESAAAELTEADVQKITGGALIRNFDLAHRLTTAPDANKVIGTHEITGAVVKIN